MIRSTPYKPLQSSKFVFAFFRIWVYTLPEGFEVRKNVFGQAVVLPKGSDGLLIK